MSFTDALRSLQPIMGLLPEVKKPDYPPSLKDKLLWTALILGIFFVLGQIFPIGLDSDRVQVFQRLDILLGSKTGSLITAGIGPIVLASIFLQLAKGSGLISLDFSKQEDKIIFQGLQKTLAILLSFGEAFIYVFSNYITAAGAGSSGLPPLFGSVFITQLIVALQLAGGSIILIYLDEVVQRYGIGSGISLFIAAGVSQAIFVGAFSLVLTPTGMPSGLIPGAITLIASGDVVTAFWNLVPILFTIAVFLVVVYVEGMKIELPLAYGKARGLGARYPIKFLYVSNIPVILASALLLNIQLFGLFLSGAGIGVLGTYQNNQPIDGLAYFVTALPSPLLVGGYENYLRIILTPREITHMFTYGIALVILCVIFGYFWIESTGMGSRDVAKQLEQSGLQIPGFRPDPRITEKILEKYIPIITILGSIFVGILAWFADVTGALGTGTGILLTVGIVYRFYEDLAQQQLFELYPVLKNIVR
ncbi:MAG: preprotein translocase subunit SecY [Candidatus Micrarchaeota archaeon]